jgi:aminopeptidase N
MKRILVSLALVFSLLVLPGCGLFSPAQPGAPVPSTAVPTGPVTETPASPSTPAAAASTPSQATVSGGQSIGDTYLPDLGNTGYEVERYDLRFTLDPLVTAVSAEAAIQARSTVDNLSQLSLDFVGFQIQKLSIDGSALKTYSRNKNKLVIVLPNGKQAGQEFSIDITYAGKPTSGSGTAALDGYYGFQFEPDHKDVYTMGEPGGAEYWFPCNDHPRDKATYHFEITVPTGYQGVANGQLTHVDKDIPGVFPGGKAADRFTWDMAQPTATYLALVAAGPYYLEEGKTPDGIPLRSYIYSEDKDLFERGMKDEQIGKALDWMTQKFGPYPFGQFGYVEIGAKDFSMETQSMIMLSNSMLASFNNGGVMVHEMAHMWFGDWVSLDSWADIWRNEGFATYIAALWEDQIHPGTLNQLVQVWRQQLNRNPPTFRLDQPPPNDMFSQPSYFEGALLAHDLHQSMGDEAFFMGLQAYFKDYGGQTASEAQFQAEMEKAAGKPLGSVFSKWFAPGLPPG